MSGACMLLLEAMPAEVAHQISRKFPKLVVFGIGAGNKLDGQLIILHDLLGLYPTFRPWFAKCYIPDVLDDFRTSLQVDDIKKYGIATRDDGLGKLAYLAIKRYVDDVRASRFPTNDYTYPIKEEDLRAIQKSSAWTE